MPENGIGRLSDRRVGDDLHGNAGLGSGDQCDGRHAGQLADSRAAFEARRRLSVATNSVNGVQSVYGAALNVPNVLDAFVIDNPTDDVVQYGSTHYPLPAHSLFVSALGGDPAAIAAANWSKKAPAAITTAT
jgi:hypothetical protein